MKTIEARVINHTHLQLLQPIQLPKHARVMVAVYPLEGDERATWLQASADYLNSAYGEDEPEYSLAMIRESNPEYGQ